MAKRRTFSPEFKFETILDMLRGEKRVAQICRERDITESLLYKWRDAFFERAPSLLADQRSTSYDPQAEHIGELERLVGGRRKSGAKKGAQLNRLQPPKTDAHHAAKG
jgi:transposase-like protein